MSHLHPKVVAMPHEKNCSVCRRLLPLTAFYKASGASDGHQARCKECHLQRVRAYRARLRARNAANPPASEVKKMPPLRVDEAGVGLPPERSES